MRAETLQPVPELPAGELSTFKREFYDRSQPVVLKGLARQWKAFSEWGLDAFKERFGDSRVVVTVPPATMYSKDSEEHRRAIEAYSREELRLADYVDHLKAEPNTKKYLEALPVKETLPKLWEDITLPPYIPQKLLYTSTLWVGPKGTTTSLHYDIPHNTLVQIAGRKKIVLYKPGEASKLYPISWRARHFPLSSSVNISAPDLTRFPKFDEAQGLTTVLSPGDGLFLPGCWWHEVHNLDITVAINFWWRPPFAAWLDPSFLYLGVRGLAAHLYRAQRIKSEKKKAALQKSQQAQA